MSEGFNSVIQALKYAARGFRSFQNYRTRICFFVGNSTSDRDYHATEMPEEPRFGEGVTIREWQFVDHEKAVVGTRDSVTQSE
jgi:hypothetical protein